MLSAIVECVLEANPSGCPLSSHLEIVCPVKSFDQRDVLVVAIFQNAINASHSVGRIDDES
jgi:hypothetical protein